MSTAVQPEPTTTTPAPNLEAAGAALKAAGNSWETVGAPPVIEAPASVEPTTEAPAEPVAAPEPSQFEGFTVDEKGGLHRPDGTMASTDEITGYNAEVSAEQPTPSTEPTAEPTAEVVKIRARNGTEMEIEVSDPLIAEALNATMKDGMRGAEYRKKLAEVEEHLADRRAFERMIETNPEGVILKHLPENKRISLAVQLVAQYWDQIAPELVKFDADPVERVKTAAKTGQQISEQERVFEQMTATERYSVQMEHATRALVPDHIEDALAERFLADAGSDIGRALRQRNGATIPVEEIKQILAPRLALYGFDKPASAASSSTPPSAPPARPIARAVVKPSSATTAQPTVNVSANAGAQVRRAVSAQRVAAAVPPAGAGAATVRAPLVPPNASIESASQALRKQRSW